MLFVEKELSPETTSLLVFVPTNKVFTSRFVSDKFILSTPSSQSIIVSSPKLMIKNTGIDDLRFHDLRHEAISRYFEMHD